MAIRPGCPNRSFTVETAGPLTFLRNPHCACALLFDPGRLVTTRPLQWNDTVPAQTTTRTPTTDFRGSITQPQHSLSTLRRMDHSTTTQDSLPVAGQTLPDGLGYPQGSNERFPCCLRLHHFLLPQALRDARFVSSNVSCVLYAIVRERMGAGAPLDISHRVFRAVSHLKRQQVLYSLKKQNDFFCQGLYVFTGGGAIICIRFILCICIC